MSSLHCSAERFLYILIALVSFTQKRCFVTSGVQICISDHACSLLFNVFSHKAAYNKLSLLQTFVNGTNIFFAVVLRCLISSHCFEENISPNSSRRLLKPKRFGNDGCFFVVCFYYHRI